MNCKLHTRRNILSLLASISFLIFLDAGEDSSLLGLLVLGPKGDHHGEVWLHAAAHMAPVAGDHGVGPPCVSVNIPCSRVPAVQAPLMKPHCVSFIPVRYTDLYALPPSSNI